MTDNTRAAVNPPHPTDVHVGARIRQIRVLRNMSQEFLGEKLNVTFQQVQKYEKGTNRVSASKLLILAQVLEVKVAAFFDGLETGSVVRDLPTVSYADIEMAKRFKLLPRKQRENIASLIDGLMTPPDLAMREEAA